MASLSPSPSPTLYDITVSQLLLKSRVIGVFCATAIVGYGAIVAVGIITSSFFVLALGCAGVLVGGLGCASAVSPAPVLSHVFQHALNLLAFVQIVLFFLQLLAFCRWPSVCPYTANIILTLVGICLLSAVLVAFAQLFVKLHKRDKRFANNLELINFSPVSSTNTYVEMKNVV
eukprot:TRINITY_DN13016_c0_g1_i1.p1 TRINITY_DN13016_c0_g1~~TRINITY_DN13016_c0_g1_i1.p1  ORF type:complete len:174 (+),score=31.83 TRINITY_DN13016_c0_g1_i1:91-612(+)